MNLTLSNISYQDKFSSNAKLISIPVEGQTYDFILQDGIDQQNYTLSSRNGAGSYLIPTEKSKLYLNFIPQKVYVSDSNLKKYIDTEFSYFIPAEIIPPDKFTLVEGQIFRCVKPDSLPGPKESYTYYIIEQGKKKLIPNYKTLEVMLAERNLTLLSVKIVAENECQQIDLLQDQIPDKSSVWTEDYADQTNFEKLKQLDQNVKDGAKLAEGAKAEADKQIAAVKAAEEKAKAEADAAKAQSLADKAAADLAIAQAEQAKAEADAKKAEFDAKINL